MKRIRKYIHKYIKQIGAIFCAVLLLFAMCFTQTVTSTYTVSAYSEQTNAYDKTSVIDDLGETVVAEYALLAETSGGSPQVHTFVEYCFSDSESLRNEFYALYVYVFNPAREDISERAGTNRVNMAVEYDSKGNPTKYENLRLKFCGKTSGKYDRYFYKYRIMGVESVLNNAVEYQAKNGKRRYDLADIDLFTSAGTAIDDDGISLTYYITGYGQGLGAGAEKGSTLTLERKQLETVNLEVKHATYRTGTYVDYVCDEINTVYFEVDKRFFDDYGNLQKIKADWYEYKTKLAYVTSDADAYDGLYAYVGKEIAGEYDENIPYSVLWDCFTYSDKMGEIPHFYNGYNVDEDEVNYDDSLGFGFELDPYFNFEKKIDLLFKKEGATTSEEYNVSREDVITWFEDYTERFPTQEKVLNRYASGLFADSIDEDRLALLANQDETCGYITQEIDAGEERNLLVPASQSDWDRFWHGVKYEEQGYSPIVVLNPGDLDDLTERTFGEEYLIGESDRAQVYNDVKAMLDNGKYAVLFRFAQTDYYACKAYFTPFGDYGYGFPDTENGYVAQETVFLDFDIISLTFRKDAKDTVIGVASTPIDIINGFDAPPNMNTDEGCLAGCESIWDGLISFIILLAVIWIISLIVRLIRRVVGWFKKK